MYRARRALITGASSGIGEAFAAALAQRKAALLLAARSEDRLKAIADNLTARHDVPVEVFPIDLSEVDAPRKLKAWSDQRHFEPDLLVNNAGIGSLGPFAKTPLQRQVEIVRLNAEALVALTGLYLPGMIARGRGAVLNVASSAAFQPVPHMAVYAASKAFVVSFSQALWAETRQHGVRIVTVCPGPVAGTRFGEGANMDASFFTELRSRPREAVVADALRALDRNQPMIIPGLSNSLTAALATVTPRRLQLLITERLFRRYLRQSV